MYFSSPFHTEPHKIVRSTLTRVEAQAALLMLQLTDMYVAAYIDK